MSETTKQLEMWQHLRSEDHHMGCGHPSCPCPAAEYIGNNELIRALAAELADLKTLHPAADWKEEDGPVLWWTIEGESAVLVGAWRGLPTKEAFDSTWWSRRPKVEIEAKGGKR